MLISYVESLKIGIVTYPYSEKVHFDWIMTSMPNFVITSKSPDCVNKNYEMFLKQSCFTMINL